MNCSAPPELDDLQILAYLDGEAGDEIARHIAECSYCRARAERLRRFETQLSSGLYRVTCPTSMELGEYELGMLDRAQVAVIDAHVKECPHCLGELAQLRSFLGDLAPTESRSAVEQVKQRARVLIATLIDELKGPVAGQAPVLAPSYAGIRGGEQGPAFYQADGIQVVLEVQPDTEQPGHRTLLGLVMGTEPPATSVQLWQGDILHVTVPVEEAGNFVIPALEPGSYRLIVSAPAVEIHIPDLPV